MEGLSHAIGRFYFLLLILGILCLQSKAETSSSVVFLDSPAHQYLRSRPSDGIAGTSSASISAGEIGAAVSVLLGFAPPATLSATSSSKINEILMPNPFDRPRHVLLLHAALSEGSQVSLAPESIGANRAIIGEMIQSQDKVHVELPAEDEAAFTSLDSLDFDASEEVTDEEISHFASWLGGSYVANDLEPVSGELIFMLPSGAELKLHLSKISDSKFTRSLISLVGSIKGAMEMHIRENLAGLITGYFKGIKDLPEYGPKGISQQGTELFLVAISKILEATQSKLKDKVVAVIVFKEEQSSHQEELLNVVSGLGPSARFLEDAKTSSISTKVAEVALVRLTLAWITGIVFIVATLLGVYLLMYMPLTRDTLLYSNVKLD
ncbi:hypothetical protein V2J09_014377 [Rumex salicifolius]